MSYLEKRDYQKIKESMLKTIEKEWKLQGKLDSLDPFVQMVLAACADELSRIEAKFDTSQANILNRLAEILMPEEWDIPKPAFGVLKTMLVPYEKEAETIIKPTDSFSTGFKDNDESYYLSATSEFLIKGAEVIFLVNRDNFYKIENFHKSSLKENTSLHSHTIWLGIELHQNLNDLKGLRFFFDWRTESDSTKYYKYIKNSRWFFNDIEITPSTSENIFEESTNLNPVLNFYENLALKFYQNAFITITKSIHVVKSKLETPSELVRFQNEIANERIDNLLWIKVEFPQEMPYEAIKFFYCTTNAFPVLNRKKCELNTYRIQGETNLIPIVTKPSESFLAIERVLGAKGTQLSYSLRRKGVERFDGREGVELLSFVSNVIQDEIHAFNELDTFGFQISDEIENTKTSLARIKNRLTENQENWENKIYVYVESNQANIGESVDVEFWTTTNLDNYPKSLSDITSDDAVGIESNCLLLTIQNGKKRPTEEEKIISFRKKLMSRGRVVTHQDISLFCHDFIGAKLKAIEIKKDITSGQDHSTGFTRCISVKLIPEQSSPNLSEWKGLCYELSNLLNEQMQVMPIIVDFQR